MYVKKLRDIASFVVKNGPLHANPSSSFLILKRLRAADQNYALQTAEKALSIRQCFGQRTEVTLIQ